MRSILKKQTRYFYCICVITLVSILFSIIVSGCTKKKEPIKIGVSTSLTGAVSTWGINVRNAVILAVEERNNDGGINGHPVELLIRDDKMDPLQAVKNDEQLIENGVVAIIGHYLSSVSVKTIPLINEKNVLMVSPGTSTADLTGIDDFFFRLLVPNDKKAPMLAKLAYDEYKINSVAVVYDTSNIKFTQSFFQHFKNEFKGLGGRISKTISTDSSQDYSAPKIAEEIIESRPKGVLLVTYSFQSALICQHLRQSGFKGRIIDSGWSFNSPDFLSTGGNSVDGVTALKSFTQESDSKPFKIFNEKFEKRFGNKISEPARNGYDAAQILFNALSKTTDPKKLKEIILQEKTFKGLDGDISFDKYGDPIRTLYIQEVQNRKIKTIGEINPGDM